MSDITINIIDSTPTFAVEIGEESDSIALNISEIASAVVVPSEIREVLEGLQSTPTDERLDASAIKNLPSGRIPWVVINNNVNASVNMAYLVNALSLVSILLPPSGSIGDEVVVYGESGTTWRINQSIGQQIRVGNKLTTSGITGELLGREIGDGIRLVCVDNTGNKWIATEVFGNIDIL